MDIRLEDVRVARNGRDVLSVQSLDMRAGRITAVLGPNGAGKTTLLRLIAGLDRPRRGQVFVGSEPADPRRRCVGYAFQDDVFLRRSILENLTLGLIIRGLDASEAHDRAIDSLRLLGIEALANRRSDHVSGGERRRANMARALCLRAPILLLDEPMAGLDRETYLPLLEQLPRVLADTGSTTLVVTHERDEAFRLCDDVVVLIGGEVRKSGTKHEVATNPRHADVAAVLGYTVLELGGRKVAAPETAWRVGTRASPISGIVETIADLVHELVLTVIVNGSRVHVRAPHADQWPDAGTMIPLDVDVLYDVT